MSLFRKTPRSDSVVPPSPVIGTAGSLREFVYLDEVSVYSLTSAPDMPPPTAMTESADSTKGEVLNAQAEGGAPLLAKANIKAELNSSRTNGLQVQRQFNIQSQFARLHGMYHPTFLLTASGAAPSTKGETSLSSALQELERSHRAVRSASLTRGALAETRVSLRAHRTFDVTAFMQLMTGLVKKYPQLLQVEDSAAIRTAMDGSDFLAELMEDLVPIEGHSTSHAIVTDPAGDLWVADIAALEAIYAGSLVKEQLRVVGVAEAASFWKDTRRILHAEAEFDVLGRVSRTGLQQDWTPVKMIETFRRVVGSAANGVIAAVDGLEDLSEQRSPEVEPTVALVVAGARLGLGLADHHGVPPTGLSPELLASLMQGGTLEAKLATLSGVADEFYAAHEGLHRDHDVVGLLRQEAWRSAHALADRQAGEPASGPAAAKPPVLELEFIAMYW